MKTYMKKAARSLAALCLFAVIVTVLSLIPNNKVQAKALDEIRDYKIYATVNDDATVTLLYHVEWTVLDSDSEGPLTWVKVGIPNSHYSNMEALSSNIKEIDYMSDSGSYARIDLDREYYAGETVVFEFSVVQDYLYQVNKLEYGYTVYSFTPGWFDDIEVDNMTICWNSDKAYSWEPDCYNIDGYLTWTKSNLSPGEKVTISVGTSVIEYNGDGSQQHHFCRCQREGHLCGQLGHQWRQ